MSLIYSELSQKIKRLFYRRKVVVAPKYNFLNDKIASLPEFFLSDEGRVIYQKRNTLRQFRWDDVSVVVKAFAKPNFIQRLIYGVFRSSKAQRSFEYASLLRRNGIGSPEPIAYVTERYGMFFCYGYYACLTSDCRNSYMDLLLPDFPHRVEILQTVARVAATMHEKGFYHTDFSRGNILFRYSDDGINMEIIDLNRIRFRKVDMDAGCRNFDRLPGNPEIFRIMADAYATARGFDADECYRLIQKYNSPKYTAV